jgi:hypothetical protein
VGSPRVVATCHLIVVLVYQRHGSVQGREGEVQKTCRVGDDGAAIRQAEREYGQPCPRSDDICCIWLLFVLDNRCGLLLGGLEFMDEVLGVALFGHGRQWVERRATN